MVIYKDKIVCFIDILGFGEIVDQRHLDNPERIHSILSKIKTSIEDWSRTPIASGIDLRITQFSDCLVFSFIPTRHYFMTFNFFKELSIQMILEGVVFRGGITYGKIYHDEEFVFGPAMNTAYRLESKLAEFPRIVIDQSALELKNDDDKTIKDYSGQFVFKIESNGYSYVDYIYDVFPYVNQSTYYEKLRAIIVKGLASEDPRIVAKYQWMKEEYNKAKNGFVDLQPL